MSATSQITWENLTDFLNNPKAPQGYAYLINGAPSIQIDLFERFYTLFWLGSVDVERVPNLFADIVDGVKGIQPLRWQSVFNGSVSIVRKCRRTVERDLFIRRDESLVYALNQPIFSLRDRLASYIRPHAPIIIAIQLELKTKINGREYELTLWADTDKSPKKEKETGITSNLLMPEVIKELLVQTSLPAQGLPRSDFDRLIEIIKDHISKRGY